MRCYNAAMLATSELIDLLIIATVVLFVFGKSIRDFFRWLSRSLNSRP
jgi:hypothetical protein